jgi:hypothetical protein
MSDDQFQPGNFRVPAREIYKDDPFVETLPAINDPAQKEKGALIHIGRLPEGLVDPLVEAVMKNAKVVMTVTIDSVKPGRIEVVLRPSVDIGKVRQRIEEYVQTAFQQYLSYVDKQNGFDEETAADS